MENGYVSVTCMGNITSEPISDRKLAVEGENVPYVAFDLTSSVDLGFGGVQDVEFKVLLLGQSLKEKWDKLKPVKGSPVVCSGVEYVNKGSLCLRVFSGTCFQVLSNPRNDLAAEGLFVSADDVFAAHKNNV